jgi:hypothetical protein
VVRAYPAAKGKRSPCIAQIKAAVQKAQPDEAKAYKPTPADTEALEAYRAAEAKRGPRLKVAASAVTIDHPDPVFGYVSLLKAV